MNVLGYTPLPKTELQKQIVKRAGKYLFPSGGNFNKSEMNPEQQSPWEGLVTGLCLTEIMIANSY